jgi:hypothetical protein
MGWAERKEISEELVSRPVGERLPDEERPFPGAAMEATVAATDPLRKFRRVRDCFFSFGFNMKLLQISFREHPSADAPSGARNAQLAALPYLVGIKLDVAVTEAAWTSGAKRNGILAS